jgi:polyvinyl alcohol dehydrogenase (cytochrome)
LKSGRVVWTKQLTANDVFNVACVSTNDANCPGTKGPDHDLGQSPILVNLPAGKRALVVGQKSGVAHALDPDSDGKILWQTRVGNGSTLGGIQWGSAADAEKMYVAVSDVARVRIAGRTVYDPIKSGGLFALQLATGEKIWSAPPARCPDNKPGCSPGHSAAVTLTPGTLFAGSLDGHLRAFSTANGQVIWDFDTAREFETTNGGKASGGAIDGPGPVVASGMLFTNSGYGAWGGMPGNVLLAFSVDSK